MALCGFHTNIGMQPESKFVSTSLQKTLNLFGCHFGFKLSEGAHDKNLGSSLKSSISSIQKFGL
jgi:hypothetical protein